MPTHIYGIRHHGPGSARSLQTALEALRPDIVLIEGPPEADALIPLVADEALRPPVALLCYVPDEPQRAVFYPFASFSPEWVAIKWAVANKVPVRFCDLPVAHSFALEAAEKKVEDAAPGAGADAAQLQSAEVAEAAEPPVKRDPVGYLAEAAGYEDGESWWEQFFEYRRDSTEAFEAVAEAMTALRTELQLPEDHRERLREAWMRKTIRTAEREMYTTIAVLCGAWHVPALLNMPKQKEDNELLKGLPKTKVAATWVPWTYDRLGVHSGYGAGVLSPGWYEHVWNEPNDDGTRWMSRVAQLFRKEGRDTSVAHVIEAVRLSGALASLRGRSRAGLEEHNEATLSVLCNGEPLLLSLLHKELIVGHAMGAVPESIPRPPLQVDLEQQQKSLRLPASADFKDYTLDLRKDMDRARSIFLHRLRLLGLKWGEQSESSGKGTFKEQWRLQWDPSFAIDIIERGSWGNTVEEAAARFVVKRGEEASALPDVAALLEEALPAELHLAVEILVRRLDALAATGGDVAQLMVAVPPLVNVTRYGNVRGTDAGLVVPIIEAMVLRVCIGLPGAASGLSDEAAAEWITQVQEFHGALSLLQRADLQEEWQRALRQLADSGTAAPLLSGFAARLLTDLRAWEGAELERTFHYRLSRAEAPARAAAWLEGFLRGSGTLLLVDESLWNLVNGWVAGLDEETFINVLPLLRRTFSLFTPPERRKLGEKAKSGDAAGPAIRVSTGAGLNEERARSGLPIVLRMLGFAQSET